MARTHTTTATTPSFQRSSSQLLLKPPPRNSFHSASIISVGDKIPAIPGFKTSAAFLSSLGANLRIPDSDLLPTPQSTPPSLRASTDLTSTLPPPSPLAFSIMASDDSAAPPPATSPAAPAAAPAADPLAGVPALTTAVAEAADDRVAALKLVADSVAQQRQAASRILLSHPVNVGAFGVVLAVVAQVLLAWKRDWTVLLTTSGGIFMALLAAVQWLTRDYIAHAESFKYEWLGDDTVLITKFGDEVIGTVVLGWEKGEKGSRRKKSGKGIVRAWAVRLKYRHKGVGRALLEEAVKLVGEKGGDGTEFAEDHANSHRVLKPEFYNKAFDKKEAEAQVLLDQIVEEQASWKKK